MHLGALCHQLKFPIEFPEVSRISDFVFETLKNLFANIRESGVNTICIIIKFVHLFEQILFCVYSKLITLLLTLTKTPATESEAYEFPLESDVFLIDLTFFFESRDDCAINFFLVSQGRESRFDEFILICSSLDSLLVQASLAQLRPQPVNATFTQFNPAFGVTRVR